MFSSQVQFHLCVNAVYSFVIVIKLQHAQPVKHHPEAPSIVELSHHFELLPNRLISLGFWLVVVNGLVNASQITGLTNASLVLLLDVLYNFTLFGRP